MDIDKKGVGPRQPDNVVEAFPGVIQRREVLARELCRELSKVLGRIRDELGYEARIVFVPVVPEANESESNEAELANDIDRHIVETYRRTPDYNVAQADHKMQMRFLNPEFADANSAKDIDLIWQAKIAETRVGRELLEIVGGCLSHPDTPANVLAEIFDLIKDFSTLDGHKVYQQYAYRLLLHPNLAAEIKCEMLRSKPKVYEGDFGEIARMCDRDLEPIHIEELLKSESRLIDFQFVIVLRRTAYAADERNFAKMLDGCKNDLCGYVQLYMNPHMNQEQLGKIKTLFYESNPEAYEKDLFKACEVERANSITS